MVGYRVVFWLCGAVAIAPLSVRAGGGPPTALIAGPAGGRWGGEDEDLTSAGLPPVQQ
jgi:hypothetical protein